MIKFGSKTSFFLCIIVIYLIQPFDTHGEESRFIKIIPKNHSSPIIDTETGLTWSQKTVYRKKDIIDVGKYVENSSHFEMNWRLPSAEELKSISTCGESKQQIFARGARFYNYGFYPIITNQINDRLFNAYIPLSDSKIISSKGYIRMVQGNLDKNHPVKKSNCYLMEIDNKIQDIIKVDGAAYIKGILVPTDDLAYPCLTFCPIPARMFVTLDTDYIKNLPMEKLVSYYLRTDGGYTHVRLYQIKDFYDESKIIENSNKFELLDKREEFTTKLAKIHQEYKKEYS